MRPYVDVIAVLALSFALTIDHFSAFRYRYVIWSLTIVAVIWTSFNMYLFWRGIVPPDGTTLEVYYQLVQNIL
jgi:hypothetical protein